MYLRATTINGDPSRVDEGIAFVRDRVEPVVAGLPGNLGLSMFVERTTGITTVSTAWESEAARAGSDAVLTPLRAEGARALGGAMPVTELFELAVIDRLRPAQEGFWSRLTRVSIDPASVDEAVDAYGSSVVHDLRLMDGYCSAALLVDRSRGLGLVSVTFDSRAHLEASREQAAQIRRTGSEKVGADVAEVRESEIAIAGLRLPQAG